MAGSSDTDSDSRGTGDATSGKQVGSQTGDHGMD